MIVVVVEKAVTRSPSTCALEFSDFYDTLGYWDSIAALSDISVNIFIRPFYKAV